MLTIPALVATLLAAPFTTPYSVASDTKGNVFVSDRSEGTVSEINGTSGAVFPIASGLENPWGIAIDTKGNVYVAESNRGAVKEIVATNGSIADDTAPVRTLATGFLDPAGIAVDASGNVYVADQSRGAVKEIVAVDGSVPPAPSIRTLATNFSKPAGLAVDSKGNLYVADPGNSTVDEILARDGSIPASPVMRRFTAGFERPFGVAVDGQGNLFVADPYNGSLKEVFAIDGTIPDAPNVATLDTPVAHPVDLALDASGTAYVADLGAYEQPAGVKVIPTVGALAARIPANVFPYGGGSPAIDASNTLYTWSGEKGLIVSRATRGRMPQLPATSEIPLKIDYLHTMIAAGTGLLFVTETLSGEEGSIYEVSVVRGNASITAIGHLAIDDGFSSNALAADPSENLFVADGSAHTLKEYLAVHGRIPAHPTVRTIGVTMSDSVALAAGPSGQLYIANLKTGNVGEIQAVGGRIPANPSIQTIASGIDGLNEIVADSAGKVYVLAGDSVKEVAPATKTIASGLIEPGGLAVDRYGNLYLENGYEQTIQQFLTADGAEPAAATLVSATATDARVPFKNIVSPAAVSEVWQLSISPSDALYVGGVTENTDTSGCLRCRNGSSYISVLAKGSATIKRRIGVATSNFALDPRGNVFVLESSNGIDGPQAVEAYRAGSNASLWTFDGGYGAPVACALDKSGNLYVGYENHTVRLFRNGKPSSRLTLHVGFEIRSMTTDADSLYVGGTSDKSGDAVAVYSLRSGVQQRRISTGVDGPLVLAIDGRGDLNVLNTGQGGFVTVYAPGASIPLRTIARGIHTPLAMVFGPSGNLFVANNPVGGQPSVVAFAPGSISPAFTIQTGPPQPLPAKPSGNYIAFDSLGNLYVTYDQGIQVYAGSTISTSRSP